MENVLGFFKYEGNKVQEGYLDARLSAEALLSFDRALRYFIEVENPEWSAIEFEIPVGIRRGSWEAFIPASVDQWIKTIAGLAATNYLVTAAKKTAENDFREASFKKIFQGALRKIVWAIKIAKHLGALHKAPQKTSWKNNNTFLIIQNAAGEELEIPIQFFDAYASLPADALAGLAQVVETERILRLGVNENEEVFEVSINPQEKSIFVKPDNPEDILFPELQHGHTVTLEGMVTRGNERTNSIGFLYQGHVLNCHPTNGSIVRFKPSMFLPNTIRGVISRTEKDGVVEKKPRIIFDSLLPLPGTDLF